MTEEERDYMVAEYVKDPRMRRHMGIGRRLAPLLDGDRRLAELLHAVLFSLPGSPVIYYGDEILMGDNVYLGDRDSVRTPMQWSPDRNAGFSRADFAQLYLPPLMDPVYGFEAVNVEAHRRNPSSHLHWLQQPPADPQAVPGVRHGHLRAGAVRQPVDPGLRPQPGPRSRGRARPAHEPRRTRRRPRRPGIRTPTALPASPQVPAPPPRPARGRAPEAAPAQVVGPIRCCACTT